MVLLKKNYIFIDIFFLFFFTFNFSTHETKQEIFKTDAQIQEENDTKLQKNILFKKQNNFQNYILTIIQNSDSISVDILTQKIEDEIEKFKKKINATYHKYFIFNDVFNNEIQLQCAKNILNTKKETIKNYIVSYQLKDFNDFIKDIDHFIDSQTQSCNFSDIQKKLLENRLINFNKNIFKIDIKKKIEPFLVNYYINSNYLQQSQYELDFKKQPWNDFIDFESIWNRLQQNNIFMYQLKQRENQEIQKFKQNINNLINTSKEINFNTIKTTIENKIFNNDYNFIKENINFNMFEEKSIERILINNFKFNNVYLENDLQNMCEEIFNKNNINFRYRVSYDYILNKVAQEDTESYNRIFYNQLLNKKIHQKINEIQSDIRYYYENIKSYTHIYNINTLEDQLDNIYNQIEKKIFIFKDKLSFEYKKYAFYQLNNFNKEVFNSKIQEIIKHDINELLEKDQNMIQSLKNRMKNKKITNINDFQKELFLNIKNVLPEKIKLLFEKDMHHFNKFSNIIISELQNKIIDTLKEQKFVKQEQYENFYKRNINNSFFDFNIIWNKLQKDHCFNEDLKHRQSVLNNVKLFINQSEIKNFNNLQIELNNKYNENIQLLNNWNFNKDDINILILKRILINLFKSSNMIKKEHFQLLYEKYIERLNTRESNKILFDCNFKNKFYQEISFDSIWQNVCEEDQNFLVNIDTNYKKYQSDNPRWYNRILNNNILNYTIILLSASYMIKCFIPK
jgi:hypothetical protein